MSRACTIGPAEKKQHWECLMGIFGLINERLRVGDYRKKIVWSMQWISVSQPVIQGQSDLLYLSVGCRTGIETLGSSPVPSVYDQHFPCYLHRLLSVSATSSQQRFFPWLPLCEQDSQSLVSSSYRCWAWLRSVWEARCHRGDRGQMWLA